MLLNFFTLINDNWVLAMLITFVFWPGLMFLVGWIGESRIIPIVEHQSRAFLPGDLTFGVMFVVLAMFYTESNKIDPSIIETLEDWSWIGFCIVIAIIIFIVLRRNERFVYPRRAFRSPTKICHDIIGYGIIPFMLLYMEYPAISLFIRNPDLRKLNFVINLIILMWMLYGFCWWSDYGNAKMIDNVKYMHIAHWQPLWKKTPPQ